MGAGRSGWRLTANVGASPDADLAGIPNDTMTGSFLPPLLRDTLACDASEVVALPDSESGWATWNDEKLAGLVAAAGVAVVTGLAGCGVAAAAICSMMSAKAA